jgi:hypothetical protein
LGEGCQLTENFIALARSKGGQALAGLVLTEDALSALALQGFVESTSTDRVQRSDKPKSKTFVGPSYNIEVGWDTWEQVLYASVIEKLEPQQYFPKVHRISSVYNYLLGKPNFDVSVGEFAEEWVQGIISPKKFKSIPDAETNKNLENAIAQTREQLLFLLTKTGEEVLEAIKLLKVQQEQESETFRTLTQAALEERYYSKAEFKRKMYAMQLRGRFWNSLERFKELASLLLRRPN